MELGDTAAEEICEHIEAGAISVACAKEMKPDEVFDNLPTIIVTRGLLPTDRVVAQG